MSEWEGLPEPPRRVSLGLKTQSLFGGGFGYFGWPWLAFSMIFWLAFGGTERLLLAVNVSMSEAATTSGVIESWEDTNTEINERTLEALVLRYEVEGEAQRAEVSVVEGTPLSSPSGAVAEQVGDEVAVEYLVDRPGVAHVVGTPWSGMPLWLLPILGLFPMIGLIATLVAFRKGWRSIGLLRGGVMVWGEMVREERTNTMVNDERVYRYVFEFRTRKGETGEASHSTHRDFMDVGDRCAVLYDPEDPSRAVLLDGIGGKPEVKEGRLVSKRPLFGALILILPAVVAAMVMASLL